MARADEEASAQPSSQPSIDHLLHNLLDRPNVESAIILSRTDGSIIRASGFGAVEKRRRARSLAAAAAAAPPPPPPPPPPPARQMLPGEPAEQLGLGTSSEQVLQDNSHSPAEELAVSILQCMQAADSLGSVLATVTSEEKAEDYPSRKLWSEANATESDASKTSLSDESAVQLLRLRVKQREIIIFPDPRYLCCVVQHVGKPAGLTGR